VNELNAELEALEQSHASPQKDDDMSNALVALPPAERASDADLRGDLWRPIETAPKDGTHVLLWCVDLDGSSGRAEAGSWHDHYGGSWWDRGMEYTLSHPRYWMPLPSPPAPVQELSHHSVSPSRSAAQGSSSHSEKISHLEAQIVTLKQGREAVIEALTEAIEHRFAELIPHALEHYACKLAQQTLRRTIDQLKSLPASPEAQG
jgi:hypothetical protein